MGARGFVGGRNHYDRCVFEGQRRRPARMCRWDSPVLPDTFGRWENDFGGGKWSEITAGRLIEANGIWRPGRNIQEREGQPIGENQVILPDSQSNLMPASFTSFAMLAASSSISRANASGVPPSGSIPFRISVSATSRIPTTW